MKTLWRTLACCMLVVAIAGGIGGAATPVVARATKVTLAAPAPRCKALNAPSDIAPAGSTTIDTLEQGYWCLLDHYVSGNQLDDRVLIRGAAKLLQTNLGGATLFDYGKLTGDRTKDWMVFRQALMHFINAVPGLSLVENIILQAALEGMALSLKDDHTGYLPPQYMKLALAQLAEGPAPSFGLVTSPITTSVRLPLFIASIQAGGVAALAGLRPGDVIEQINGAQPATAGTPSLGLVSLLLPQDGATLTLTIRRPLTGATIELKLAARNVVSPVTASHLIAKNIAYVKLFVFSTHAARRVFADVAALKRVGKLAGLVLDLRGNPGGEVDQAVAIASAFVHAGVLGYTVNGKGRRDVQHTDDSISLLHLPLVVLIDGGSASSAELIAGAVKDSHVGLLVGERSMGALAEAGFYGLGDGGGMEITIAKVFGPHNETVDGVGVTPDLLAVTRAADLSAGHDPAIDAAVRAIRANPQSAS